MQYEKVDTNRFRECTLDFVNEKTLLKIENIILSVDLYSRIRTLIRNDETGFMEYAAPAIFESVVADRLIEGVRWKKCQSLLTDDTTKWTDFNLKLKHKIIGPIPKYQDLLDEVLYIPSKKIKHSLMLFIKMGK